MEVKTSTIARTIILILVLINVVLKILGITPVEIDDNLIYQLVTVVTAIAVPLWAWWKNNSFTPAAIEADKVLELLRMDGIPALEELLLISGVIAGREKENNYAEEM